MAKKITGYSFAAKKTVPIQSPVISKHEKGGRILYHVKGKDKDGNVVCTAMGKDDAKEHIKAKTAKKGTGW